MDTAWLRMDSPANPMMITGVLLLDRQPEPQAFAHHVLQRLVRPYPRFSQQVQSDWAGPVWAPTPDFDIHDHIHWHRLPAQATQADLQQRASALASTPLSPERPLWRMDMLSPFEGGVALVLRVHHCLADGLALVSVLLSITDAQRVPLPAAPAPAAAAPANAAGGPPPHTAPPARPQGTDPITEAVVAGAQALQWGQALWQKALPYTQNPQAALALGVQGLGWMNELSRWAQLPDDSPTRFKGPVGLRKAVAWAPPLPLAEVKAVAQAVAGTVNDVLLGVLAGALRRHLQAQGDEVDGVLVRTMVPVNLRSGPPPPELGNHFGLVALDLPVGEANPVARVHAVRAQMLALKQSAMAPLSLAVLGALGVAPPAVQSQALSVLSTKASAVTTNVPGPASHRHLAGAQIRRMLFWVPQAGHIGLGVSILSYAQEVQFGLMADQQLLPQPQALLDQVQREWSLLVHAVLLAGQGDAHQPQRLAAQMAWWCEQG